MIKLFSSTSLDFSTNGIGYLPDAVICKVHEERNGEYELEMQYPITGRRFSEISLHRILVVKPNPYDSAQPFRIYAITKPIHGIVTIHAAHLSYDLSGYPVSPFYAESIGTAFLHLENASILPCPFLFWTDKTDTGLFSLEKPASIRSVLGSSDNSFIKSFGGELEFDGYNVKLHNNRGRNRGVSIRYGKNLTNLEQEENCAEVFTGVYPFWISDEEFIELSEKYIQAEGTYDFVRIYPLDLSSEFEEPPTEDQLRYSAAAWMQENKIGVPKVSLKVSFIPLSQTEEYRQYALLETVHLCDTVNVEFPALGVHATAKCIATTYDVLTDKYVEIELGEPKANLTTVIVEQNQSIKDIPSKSFLEDAVEHATALITGGLGGYVILHNSMGRTKPDEILIMDTDNIRTAMKVWRWNQEGLGYSSTGYAGPYTTAITSDGQIVANFITAGEFDASIIKANTIQTSSISLEYTNSIHDAITGSADTLRQEFLAADGVLSASISDTRTYAMGLASDVVDYVDGRLDDYVPTSQLESSVSLYMQSAAGQSDIVLAAAGTFVKAADLSDILDAYLTEDDLPSYDDLIEMIDLHTSIQQYLNSTEGKAAIVSSVSGQFVKPSDLSGYATTSSVASISQQVTNLGSEISLSSAYGSNTIGSNVRALLTLFANKDSSSIRFAANALTLEATSESSSSTTTETDVDVTITSAAYMENGVFVYPYEFVKTSDGYYTSQNAGQGNSVAYAYVNFNLSVQKQIILRCINYAEPNCDYGIVSVLDRELLYTNQDDSGSNASAVLRRFNTSSSLTPVDIPITVPAGSHYITIKFIKDGSVNLYNDSFKFRCLTITENSSSGSTILKLKSNGVLLSSADISIVGPVTFSDLEQEGRTVINGANILTDNLHVKTVFFDEASYQHRIIESTVTGSAPNVFFGASDMIPIGSNRYARANLILRGGGIYFLDQGYSYTTSQNAFCISPAMKFMEPNSGGWKLGSTDKMFQATYSTNYYFNDGAYLTTNYAGDLIYYYPDGEPVPLTERITL